LARLFIPIPP